LQPSSYSSIWIQQTPLYGEERVSLDLWCHAGLILSKTWVENHQWTPAVSTISVATDSPRDNKLEPTALILPYGSNKHHCMDKKRERVSLGLWCHAGLILSKTWVENQQWTPAVSTISVATDSPRDITNSNQPLLFFHMDPTNTTVWARKSLIGSVMSLGVDFEQNLG
jgi:hypothetical protein